MSTGAECNGGANLQDVVFIEEEDGLKMHVIQPLEDLRKNSFTTEEMLEEMRRSRKEEMELEY